MTEDRTFVQNSGGLLSSSGTVEFSGITATILLGDDAASLTVMEMVVDPGKGGPAHISPREDKVFHISKGPILFLVGEERIEANDGDHLFVGKGQVHSFNALGEHPARMTLVSTPSHHHRFFQALSALPTPHEPNDVEAVCIDCDQQIVGPVVQP